MSYEIIIDGSKMLWTTSFEVEDNSEPNEVTTHTGVLTNPPEVGNYTVSIDRASAYDYVEEQEIFDILEKAKKEEITIVAVKKTKKGILRTTCTNCIRTSYSESVDENGEMEFSTEFNSQSMFKEFLKA
ncbi:MAG: hypothetical protein MR352_00035 [Ruminococcus sp.]|nr:hypothetical protein [Ruminococcus sp.]MCI5616454.1 hypothetical protein [Ruminococcus sp.]